MRRSSRLAVLPSDAMPVITLITALSLRLSRIESGAPGFAKSSIYGKKRKTFTTLVEFKVGFAVMLSYF